MKGVGCGLVFSDLRYPKEKIDRYRSDRLFGTDNDWRTPTAQLTAGARDHREN